MHLVLRLIRFLITSVTLPITNKLMKKNIPASSDNFIRKAEIITIILKGIIER
jgi:hypothetical protein